MDITGESWERFLFHAVGAVYQRDLYLPQQRCATTIIGISDQDKHLQSQSQPGRSSEKLCCKVYMRTQASLVLRSSVLHYKIAITFGRRRKCDSQAPVSKTRSHPQPFTWSAKIPIVSSINARLLGRIEAAYAGRRIHSHLPPGRLAPSQHKVYWQLALIMCKWHLRPSADVQP